MSIHINTVVENVPYRLKEHPYWLIADPQKDPHSVIDFNKSQYDRGYLPRCNSIDGCVSFDEALAALYKHNLEHWGLGIRLGPFNSLVVVDYDHVADPVTGEISPWAVEAMDKVSSYTERSLSGKGFHQCALSLTSHPDGVQCGRHASFIPGMGQKFEYFDHEKYIFITGKLVEKYGSLVIQRTMQLDELHKHFFPQYYRPPEKRVYAPCPTNMTVESVLRCIQYSKRGKLFFERFASLPGSPANRGLSDSEVDFYLCGTLARYIGPNHALIEAVMRQSLRARPKWDKMHGSATYLEITIQRAIAKG